MISPVSPESPSTGEADVSSTSTHTVLSIDRGTPDALAGTGTGGTPNEDFCQQPARFAERCGGRRRRNALHPHAANPFFGLDVGRRHQGRHHADRRRVRRKSARARRWNAGDARGLPGDPASRRAGRLVYLGTRFAVYRVGSRFSGFGPGERIAASRNKTRGVDLRRDGRHLRTIDSITGFRCTDSRTTPRAADERARSRRLATTIERRRGVGRPTAIVAPGGARTELALSGDGYVSTRATPPAQRRASHYDAGGRMTQMIDRRGGPHTS